jgi:LmbE family N-acetylglucosaminyl deacetylase
MVSHGFAGLPLGRRLAAIAAISTGLFSLTCLCILAYAFLRPAIPPPIAENVAIVVSPHPDDEAYAMGQTIASQVLAGKRVIGVLVSDGEESQLVERWAAKHGRDLNDDGVVDKWDFSLARREEYRAAMNVLDLEELVFLGSADTRGEYGFRDGSIDASELEERLASLARAHPEAAWFTTAPHRWDYLFFGDYENHPDHAQVANAVKAVATASGGVAYTYKTYVYLLPPHLRRAPLRVEGTPEALRLKRSMIEAYSTIGAMSTPELYEAAMEDTHEYLMGTR